MPRKVQSAYYDTNVFTEALTATGETCECSVEALQLASQKVLMCMGSETVRAELKGVQEKTGSDILLRVYEDTIHIEVPAVREVWRIQSRYLDEVKIKSADALHLALASFNRADVLLSWNREDIVKEKTIRAVARVNVELRIPVPAILTPRELLTRGRFSASRRSLILD